MRPKRAWTCPCCGRTYDLSEEGEQCMVTIGGREGCWSDACPINGSWKELGFKMVIKDVLITLEVDDQVWVAMHANAGWTVRGRDGYTHMRYTMNEAAEQIAVFARAYKAYKKELIKPITLELIQELAVNYLKSLDDFKIYENYDTERGIAASGVDGLLDYLGERVK